MNLDNNKVALAFLSIVVIASGCSHTAGTGDDAGSTASVAIQNFSAFPQNPYNNRDVNLRLSVKNNGDTDAEDVAAKLYNVPFKSDFESTGQNQKTWEINDGNKWRHFEKLDAADPDNDIPARQRTFRWRITAPDISDSLDTPYTFKTRLYYKYNTTGTSRITLMTQDRFQEVGGGSRPSVDNSAGPIKMEIRTRTPIVFYNNQNRDSEMCIVVRNQGSGTPIHPDAYSSTNKEYTVTDGTNSEEGQGNKNQVQISVPSQAGMNFVADGEGSGNTQTVRLIGNRGVACYEIDAASGSITEEVEVPIQVEAEYGYYKDASQTVTVRGSSRFPDNS